MGLDPAQSPFKTSANVSEHLESLISPELILIDRKSLADYGPQNGEHFSEQDIGVETQVGGQPVKVVGLFMLGSGLTANGAMIVNEQGFDRLFPYDSRRQVSCGLVRLKPGVTEEQKNRLQARLQQRYTLAGSNRAAPQTLADSDSGDAVEIEVLNRGQVLAREERRWLAETPIGFIFNMGVGISLVVGAAIVYMILSTDVANRLKEYATLKAMGYTNIALAWIVLRQAMYLAVFAFAPALLLSLILYALTEQLAQIPIGMTGSRVIAGFRFVFADVCRFRLPGTKKALASSACRAFLMRISSQIRVTS